MLNFFRYRLLGYKTPRPFSAKHIDKTISYDFEVVERWLKHLKDYSMEKDPLTNKTILELGPGPDLGVGLILLAMGAKKYIALDVNKLALSASEELYTKLFASLKEKYKNCDIDYLRKQLANCNRKEDSALIYIVDKNFDLSKIKYKVDIVFSQAAFEHFTNVEKVFKELAPIIAENGMIISEIDFQTHTRWLRNKDPLNIYRYNNYLWNLFKFKGSPNRVRLVEYKSILMKNGWCDLEIVPLTMLEDNYFLKIRPSMAKKFRDISCQEMKVLNAILMARKG